MSKDIKLIDWVSGLSNSSLLALYEGTIKDLKTPYDIKVTVEENGDYYDAAYKVLVVAEGQTPVLFEIYPYSYGGRFISEYPREVKRVVKEVVTYE